MALGRYFAGLVGRCRAGSATPHTPSFALAPFAPRASRTTGRVAVTTEWLGVLVRAVRFYFFRFGRSLSSGSLLRGAVAAGD